jgi:periplasmic divalent cation tolerance protein
MAEEIVVFVTCPPKECEAVAEPLVKEGLAACVNIVPVRSIYIWEGELCNEAESLLVIKSSKRLFNDLAARVKVLTSNKIPEIIALSVDQVDRAYLDWLNSALARK